MKRLIGLLIVMLTVVSLVVFPLPVSAAETGQATGQITIGRQPPSFPYTNYTSEVLEVYSDAALTNVVSSMTPQVTYYVKVTVHSPNTLADIKKIKVIFEWHQANEGISGDISGTTGDTQKRAVLLCDNAGSAAPTWSIDAGAGTTWGLISAACVQPTRTSSTGTYVFAFKPGKVATKSTGGQISNDGWNIFAWVQNAAGTTASITYQDSSNNVKKGMYWYGEITNLTSQISWNAVKPGTGFADDVNEVSGITATFISNGNYKATVASSATWSGADGNTATYDNTGACGSSGQFAIKCHRTGDFSNAELITTTGTITNNTGQQTVETGDQITNGTMWLKVANVFPVDVYTGTLTFTISSR